MITYGGQPVAIVAVFRNMIRSPKIETPNTVECEFLDAQGNPIFAVRHVLVLTTELAESEPGDLDLALAGHTPINDVDRPCPPFGND